MNRPVHFRVMWRDRFGRRQEAHLPGDDEARAAQYAADHHGTYHAVYRPEPASQGSTAATASTAKTVKAT